MPKANEFIFKRAKRVRRYNGFALDGGRKAVIGKDGQPKSLRPQSFAVLRALDEQAGKVVRKDLLFDTIWQGQAVTEDSLTQCIGDIRRALEDKDKRVLETIPRQGFQIHPDDTARSFADFRLGFLFATIALLAVIAISFIKSHGPAQFSTVAITSDESTTAFAADLGNALDRYGSLGRVSRGARFAIEISTAADDRLLARVIDATNNRVIFSKTFAQEPDLVPRLAARLASPLNGEIALVLFEASENKPVEDLSAIECYLLNYQLQGNRNNDRNARRSAVCLEALLEENPRDARALALQGALYAQQYWWGVGLDDPMRNDPLLRSELASRALRSAQAADALQPSPDAATYYAMARAYYANCQREQTLAAARRALEINPDDPNILGGVGNWTAYLGNWEEGAGMARRAIDLLPQGYARWWYWPLGKSAWIAEDYEAALDGFMRAYDENSWLSQLQLAYTLPFLDRQAEANAAIDRLLELRPGFTRKDARFAYERWCFSSEYISKMDQALMRAGLPETRE